MAEELQHLIEQIQKEGVEKANEQADTIVSQAKEKAAKIVSEAEKKAAEKLKKAETDAEAFAERSVKTLEQAARDLLITVGQGCEKVVTSTLALEVEEALTPELLQKLITDIVTDSKADVELAVSEDDKEKLIAFCAEQAKKSGTEIDLSKDTEVLAGFKVGFKNQNVYLDYSSEALAEALAAFLRPQLAKIVSGVARENTANA